MALANVWCIVPAAGIGSRVGANIPKQYLTLGGIPVLEITLQKLLSAGIFQKIILVVSQQDSYFKTLPSTQDARIVVVEGGKERSDSVRSGLAYLQSIAKEDDWVMVHDAARPLIERREILGLLEQCVMANSGGILAIPVTDTLKRVNNNNQIETTVARAHLWQAQTPQCFPFFQLFHAMNFCFEKSIAITDEASAVEAVGGDCILVVGRSDNMKITRQEDLPIAEFIAQQQAVAEK